MEKHLQPIPEVQLEGEYPDRSSPGEMFVSKGRVVSLEISSPGRRVICGSGLIWLTQENDTEDYLMSERMSFAIRRPGRIVFEALQDSVVSVELYETR